MGVLLNAAGLQQGMDKRTHGRNGAGFAVIIVLLNTSCVVPGNTLHMWKTHRQQTPPHTHTAQHSTSQHSVVHTRAAYLDNVLVRQRFVRLVILGVLQQDLVHVGARVLVQLVGAAEDD